MRTLGIFRYGGVSRLPILNDGKSYSRESDFNEIEIANSSRYQGQTVIEVGKCEALRLRILMKAKGLWVRKFVISCSSLKRKIFLNFFRRLVKSVNLTASRQCNGL